jgi:hypothetical protein
MLLSAGWTIKTRIPQSYLSHDTHSHHISHRTYPQFSPTYFFLMRWVTGNMKLNLNFLYFTVAYYKFYSSRVAFWNCTSLKDGMIHTAHGCCCVLNHSDPMNLSVNKILCNIVNSILRWLQETQFYLLFFTLYCDTR